MMRNKSTAQMNVLVLVLSLLPFIIGLNYSVYKSSEKEELSSLINISGSQRMRTMLLSNYAQLLVYSEDDEDKTEYIILLKEELKKYLDFYNYLIEGNEEFGLTLNNYDEITDILLSIQTDVSQYEISVNNLLSDKDKEESLNVIVGLALSLKDDFHEVTELYQLENDNLIMFQKRLDMAMISFGVIVTIIGLVLTVQIRKNEYHAAFDYLTGLRNRHSFFSFIKNKSPSDYTMFFMDLNKFKAINDTFGHETGDEILIEATARLSKIFGEMHLFRYGGDEFIALVKTSDLSFEEAVNYIDDTCKDIKFAMTLPITDEFSRSHFIGISIGCVSSYVGMSRFGDLINLADDLMYDSKNVPDHTIVYYSEEDYQRRRRIVESMSNAFMKNLIRIGLNYQHVYQLDNKQERMLQVTSRWYEKDSEIFASEFMPIIRRKGLLKDFDKNSLLRLNDAFSDDNVSFFSDEVVFMLPLSEETLSHYENNGIKKILNELSIPRNRLIIKLQDEFLSNQKVNETIASIRDLGYLLALDITALDVRLAKQFKYESIDFIKLNHSLVEILCENTSSFRVLIEYISLIADNGKEVILEGIEEKYLDDIKKNVKTELQKNVLYSNRIFD